MVKVYAIKKGRQVGIVDTWAECHKRVNGFSGAEYKSFNGDTYNEAVELAASYLKGSSVTQGHEDILHIYVDGSYNPDTGIYGSGIVIVDKDIKTLSIPGTDQSFASMRNIAGELLAATIAMSYALKNGIKDICICYDYMGIELWCNGTWKAKNEYTQKYIDYYQSVKKHVNICFKHIKGHSGNTYNEMADKLAKNAVGLANFVPNFSLHTSATADKGNQVIQPVLSGIKDAKGRDLCLGDIITCVVDSIKYIGYLDYNAFTNRYFFNFKNYWKGHPFRKGILYYKVNI